MLLINEKNLIFTFHHLQTTLPLATQRLVEKAKKL